MSGVTRTADSREDNGADNRYRRFKVTQSHQDQDQSTSKPHKDKESSIAVVPPQKPEEQEKTFERVAPKDEKVEIIKVYLGSKTRSESVLSVKMLTDEVSQIQEVRYSLKTLREQMAARQNKNNNNKYPVNGLRRSLANSLPSSLPCSMPSSPTTVSNGNNVFFPTGPNVGDNQEECAKLREATKRLYAQLKELEESHREEKERLQAEADVYRTQLDEQSSRLQKSEEQVGEKGEKVDELQRLLGSMEKESAALRDKMAAAEAELLQLKTHKEDGEQKENRCEELEKELAILKEKIHHLDDMLKSQQRKVRHMIEQLQNSRTVIQERDRFIRDLEEKVSFLEAENREMHHHMEYFLAGQDVPPMSTPEKKAEIVYSKPLTPTSHSNKALPFIKVIEIKT